MLPAERQSKHFIYDIRIAFKILILPIVLYGVRIYSIAAQQPSAQFSNPNFFNDNSVCRTACLMSFVNLLIVHYVCVFFFVTMNSDCKAWV